jgi:hypothetical protein
MKTPKFVMSDAEKAMRRHLDRSGKIRDEDDDKGLLKWIKGLSKPLEDCRTPLERRIQQRLEGRDVEPKTQIMQQMG